MNVIVFGETGSGKSSLVNLLLGNDAATVSDGAKGCTFEFQKYETGPFALFDTVGLSEGTRGKVMQEFAVNKLVELLKSLEGGVSLLIFVMRKGRITISLEENYKLFVDSICMKSVPVVLAITHCEMEAEPGRWWNENQESANSYGWNIGGVVCCCCLTPNNAHPAMRKEIMDMRDATKNELLDAIEKTKLVRGWVVPGGWKRWIEEVLLLVLSVTCGVVLSPLKLLFPNHPALYANEYDVYKTLVTNGYTFNEASVIASAIAKAAKYLNPPLTG